MALSIIIALFHFFVPFMLLLWRKIKRDVRLLAMVALGILVIRSIDTFWVIKPMWIEREFTLHMAPEGHAKGETTAKPEQERATDPHPAANAEHPNAMGSERGHETLAEMYPNHHVEVQGVWEGGFHWTDIPALAGLGGIWIAAFAWRLRQRPLVPPNDPRLAELAAEAHH
jgi:hypothetical protein